MKYIKALIPFSVFFILFFTSISLIVNSYELYIPLYLPILFGLIYFIKSFVKLIERNKIELTNLVIITLLYFQTSLKIFYIYYNLFITLILIIVSLYFIYKFWTKLKLSNKFTTILLILTNSILFFTSDNYILGKLNEFSYSGQPWIRNVTWNDFEGEQIDSSKYSALISTSLNYKINRVYNYPQAIVISTMDKKMSWKRESISPNNAKLLKHEQGHFDIAELQTRLANDSIKNIWPSKTIELDSIINYFRKRHESFTDDYDKYTRHSLDTINQKVFDSLFDAELRTN